MSHRATNWAIERRGLKPATKIVLWHLADAHNPHHGCFPKQETLAEACEMSRSSINEHLKLLEKADLIRRVQSRCEQTNRQRATRYLLGFEFDDSPAPPREDRPQDVVVPCAESGHGNGIDSVSETGAEPCPENRKSRVQNPDTKNPVREPVKRTGNEREGAGAKRKGENGQAPDVDDRPASPGSDEKPDPATVPGRAAFERRVLAFCTGKGFSAGPWPKWDAGGTLSHVGNVMAKIDEPERREAERWRDAYLADMARRNEAPMYPGNFLKLRAWEGLDPDLLDRVGEAAKAIAPPPDHAPAFGPVWAAMRMAALALHRVPEGYAFRPSTFMRRQIEAGATTMAAERAASYVQKLDARADTRIGEKATGADLALKPVMAPVPLDSPAIALWRQAFARRRWRFPPTRNGMRVVYLPRVAADPPQETAIDAAIDAFMAEALAAHGVDGANPVPPPLEV